MVRAMKKGTDRCCLQTLSPEPFVVSMDDGSTVVWTPVVLSPYYRRFGPYELGCDGCEVNVDAPIPYTVDTLIVPDIEAVEAVKLRRQEEERRVYEESVRRHTDLAMPGSAHDFAMSEVHTWRRQSGVAT